MEARELATVELLGALAYGQLRAFDVTAKAIPLAPDVRASDLLASFAVDEHSRYVALRDHLAARTQLPWAVMDRQRSRFDDYFDRAPLDDWFSASVFFALGLPMAADFARAIEPVLDEETGAVVATLDRGEAEATAMSVLARQLDGDDDRAEHARHLAADLLGRALTGFQHVMSDTDALEVLLEADRRPGETREQRVKRFAILLLENHRRRVIELGLEDLDDVS